MAWTGLITAGDGQKFDKQNFLEIGSFALGSPTHSIPGVKIQGKRNCNQRTPLCVLWMVTVTGSETPAIRPLFPEDKLEEPRDNQECGMVGMECELGSQMNWMLISSRGQSSNQQQNSKNGLAQEIRNTPSPGAINLCIHPRARNHGAFDITVQTGPTCLLLQMFLWLHSQGSQSPLFVVIWLLFDCVVRPKIYPLLPGCEKECSCYFSCNWSKMFSQAFILRDAGGQRVRPTIPTFHFKILWIISTKLTLFGQTVGSNAMFKHSDGASSLLQRVSCPPPPWHAILVQGKLM